MLKKWRVILVFIILIMNFSGCSYTVSTSEKNGDTEGSFIGGSKEDFLKEPDVNTLKFYDNINDAILNSTVDEDDKPKSIKQIIKVLEKDDEAVVFFIADIQEKDCVNTYKLKTKKENNKIYYSEATFTTLISWSAENLIQQNSKERDQTKEDYIKELVKTDFNFYNGSTAFNIGEDKETVKWGFLRYPEIYNVKINNVPITGIEEIYLDNEQVYFWYYQGNELNEKNTKDIKVTFY